jgi:hypothetical protein
MSVSKRYVLDAVGLETANGETEVLNLTGGTACIEPV